MNQQCDNCAFINPDGMRYCGNCGTRLAEASVQTPPLSSIPDPEMIGAMIGSDLKERFQKAGLEAAGQRRNVTVLFADLVGFTELSQKTDSEDLYIFLQQFIQELAGSVYKYEGMVDKFTGDGLMALFGAPIAHENNAELAVLAALDMRSRLEEISRKSEKHLGQGLLLHIGLNSGPVIVGGIGSDLLMNYTAIGDTVNLARRLEDAASPGTILVSQPVYNQTKAIFDYTNVPGLNIKGISKPVNAFCLIGPKEIRGSVRGLESLHAPMIGRENELNFLTEAVKGLKVEGKSKFIVLSGEAGIGKSRLISELKNRIKRSELTLFEGQSLTYRKLAYWIFVDAFLKLLNVNPQTEEHIIQKRLVKQLKETLGERWKEVLPYLEQLLSLPVTKSPASERLRYLDASQLRQQIFMAVHEFLMAEARRKPVVCILEDIHWADNNSLELLSYLINNLQQTPILFLCVTRPVKEGALIEILNKVNRESPEKFHQLMLENLSPDQSEQLIFHLLTIHELSPILRDYILQRAAGIPFYLEEILRMLIDNGVIQRSEAGWKIAGDIDVDGLGVPDNLEGLILTRFDRLPEVQRRLLQTASVIGREFSLPVLQAVHHSISTRQVGENLIQLQERDFIFSVSEPPSANYEFKHALISEAIYKTMLRRDRGEIHGKIGRAVEKVYANQIESQIEILARHYSYSPLHDRALHYLIIAGQKAARNYDNSQARQHFEQAKVLFQEIDHTPEQKLAVYGGLGDILVLSGEYPEAREQYLSALDSIEGAGDSIFLEEKSNLHRKVGTTHERQGEYEEALGCLKEAKKVLGEELDADLTRAEIANDTGWIYFLQGLHDEAEINLTRALSYIEDSSQYDITASIYNRLGGIYYQKDQLDQASYYVRKSLIIREEMGDAIAVARSYNNLGLLAWRKGDWDHALDNFQRSIDLHNRLNDVEGTLNLYANIGLLLTDKGDLEGARNSLDESLKVAKKIGHKLMEGLVYHHLSRLWLAAKEWEKSLFYSNLAFRIFTEIGAQEYLLDLYSTIGEAWFGNGGLEESTKACETAKGLIEEEGTRENIGHGRVMRLMGNLARTIGNFPEANRLLKQSADHFSKFGNQLELGRTLLALARLDRAQKDLISFRLHINEARLIFKQLGAQIDLANVESVNSGQD